MIHNISPAGKPSIVMDCVFHSTHKTQPRALLTDLALTRMERQDTKVILSREVSMPNIRHKGDLEAIPHATSSILETSQNASNSTAPTRPLIEFIAEEKGKRNPQWSCKDVGDLLVISIHLPGLVSRNIFQSFRKRNI